MATGARQRRYAVQAGERRGELAWAPDDSDDAARLVSGEEALRGWNPISGQGTVRSWTPCGICLNIWMGGCDDL